MDAVLTNTLLDDSRSSRGNGGWTVPWALILASLTCLVIDVPIAYVFKTEHQQLPKVLEGPLREMLEICESFGHGFGAFLIVVAVGVLAPSKRRQLLWMLAASWGSGLMANVLKTFVHRTRPRTFDFESSSVWATFAKASGGGMDVQSFPSAHTATAVGLAVALSFLFPRGRWFFGLLAALVGVQRIVCSAHFPSDVFAGAAVGWIVSSVCVSSMSHTVEPSKDDRATA
jgi:membrane-associated phospholipid phosphatase